MTERVAGWLLEKMPTSFPGIWENTMYGLICFVVNVPAFNQCILVWDRVGPKKRFVSVYRRVDVIYVVKTVIQLAILTKSDQGCLKFSNIV